MTRWILCNVDGIAHAIRHYSYPKAFPTRPTSLIQLVQCFQPNMPTNSTTHHSLIPCPLPPALRSLHNPFPLPLPRIQHKAQHIEAKLRVLEAQRAEIRLGLVPQCERSSSCGGFSSAQGFSFPAEAWFSICVQREHLCRRRGRRTMTASLSASDSCVLEQLLAVVVAERERVISFEAVADLLGEAFPRVQVLQKTADGI